MRRNKKIQLTLATFMVILVGCHQTSDPSAFEPPKKLAIGTTFTIQYARTDSSVYNGAETDRQFDILEVVDTGLQVGSRQNITKLTENGSVYYMTTDSIGDLSIGFVMAEATVQWQSLPITSREIKPEVLDSISSSGIEIHASRVRRNAGLEQISIRGKTYLAHRIDLENSYSQSGMIRKQYRQSGSYWYIPALGFFGKGNMTTFYDNESRRMEFCLGDNTVAGSLPGGNIHPGQFRNLFEALAAPESGPGH